MRSAELLNQMTASNDYISEKSESEELSADAESLIQLIKVGDQQAFLDLFRNYHRPIYNFIYRLIHNEFGAEDVLQEVFIAIWKGAIRFQGKSSVKTWIYRITYNQSMTWLRRNRQYAGSVSIIDTPIPDAEDEADVWDRQNIQTALDQLSVKHRAVIELTFVYGMNYREIAETLRIPIGTVKSRMKYALKSLAQSLTDKGIERK